MSIKNIFSKSKKEKNIELESTQNLFVEKQDIELDEQFVQKFISNGGHFLLCDNWEEAVAFLQNILMENKWESISCHQKELLSKIRTLNLRVSNYDSAEVYLCFCESLIAKNGNVMLSSDHTNGVQIADLPKNFIIFPSPNQIVHQLSDGLQMIRKNKSAQLPSNITSITGGRNRSEFSENSGFIKNIYLLLIERFHG